MVTDETSLDWRLLMQENIFKLNSNDIDNYRRKRAEAAGDVVADGEEVDKIKFRVENLLLLGIMYCKCDRQQRVENFYMHLVPGLGDQISAGDKDLVHAMPMMGRIAYGAIL